MEPIPVVLGFLDCINRGDVDGLGRRMTDDHQLVVFDEAPLRGRAENVEAWHGYAEQFPNYRIHPSRIVEHGPRVAVLGTTTGSHLGLPDEKERALTLIWVAEVTGGRVRSWRLVEDAPAQRATLGL